MQFGRGNTPTVIRDFYGLLGGLRLFGAALTATDVQRMVTNVNEESLWTTTYATSTVYAGCVGIYQNAVQAMTSVAAPAAYVGEVFFFLFCLNICMCYLPVFRADVYFSI